MKKSLFETLKQAYKGKEMLVEVKSELEAAGRSTDVSDFLDPFKNLIIGVLSQNTSDANSVKAWVGLTEKFEITPQALAKADIRKLRKSIKSGGLHNLKSKRIKELSKAILEKFDGGLSKLTKLPKEEVREKLLELPGIGPKTADVWLTYCADQYMMAVDTNIDRVAKRLGIVPANAAYEQVRKGLEKRFAPKERKEAHEYLIRLGKDFCKPNNPLCKGCPIKELCRKKI